MARTFFDGLRIEREWSDEDLSSVVVQAGNGEFAGTIVTFVSHLRFREIVEEFRGFPRDLNDVRTIAIGNFDPQFAGGGIEIELSMTPQRCVAMVRLEHDERMQSESKGRSKFRMTFEVGSFDRFVSALDVVASNKTDVAELTEALSMPY